MFKTYEVTIRPQYPAVGDYFSTATVYARNKAEAISAARKINAREYLYDTRSNGRIFYTAKLAD